MKKLITLCVILVYGLASSGAVVCLDYCCGKLANISLSPVEKEDCDANCLSPKGCCDSKHVVLKVKGEQELVMKSISTQKQTEYSIFKLPVLHNHVHSFNSSFHFSNDPPDRYHDPLFLQYCVLRI